jgi:acyl-coenzyme A thioesterase PaaI-like protein
MKNQLAKMVDKLNSKPQWLRYRLLSFALGKTVKFVGTASVKCLHLSQDKSIFRLANRKKVRNHIGTVHAAASALVAETATGMALAMHIPDGKIPVLKAMHIDYVKRSTGGLTATAYLTEEQITQLHQLDKGEMRINCEVLDEKEVEPVVCQMDWAWTLPR